MAASWPVIIFLDLDGVLNGHQFLVEAQSCTIDPACVRRLNRLVEAADARIVLSSAWRYMVHGHAMTLKGFAYMLRTHGFRASVNGSQDIIIDLTCRDEDIPGRPDQVRAWLRSNGYADQRYVVLDDGDFGWGDLSVVLTDGAMGLTDADVERAIAILCPPEEDTAEFTEAIETEARKGDTMAIETCGYCQGAGRVAGPRYDRDGRRRDDWPDTVPCEYCAGSGRVNDGAKLLAAGRPKEE